MSALPWSLLLVALALVLPGPAPAGRLPVLTGSEQPGLPKNPRDGPRTEPDRFHLAGDIDLFAALIDAGLSTTASARAVAAAAEPATAGHWRTVAALLAVGVPPQRAWADVAHVEGLGELARLARLSDRSGAALAGACRRIATELRDTAGTSATARAERAGVLIALPLSLCFLPAFLILGLAPVVIGLGRELLPF